LFFAITMNSLNIITARVSPPTTPTQSRSNSISSIGLSIAADDGDKPLDHSDEKPAGSDAAPPPDFRDESSYVDEKQAAATEDTPLIDSNVSAGKRSSWWHSLPRDLASSILGSLRWVIATLASPGVYLLACFYDIDGNFRPLAQFKRLFGVRKGDGTHPRADEAQAVAENQHLLRPHAAKSKAGSKHSRLVGSSGSSSSGLSSDSEFDEPKANKARHARSKSMQPSEEINPARRSIRIKLHNDDAMRDRKHKRAQSAVARTKASAVDGEDMAAQLKSPTSPISALTRYPKTPAPPRPLIPRRQPSYINIEIPRKHRKTLILDLDETLIHSMSKGGRMSSGHMVEVRLNTASLGMGGQGSVGQHPILYWVNKRPYCDEFLRRVVKWFNLVIFTASVQEYADPVIDWLESERKFFSARYYRQHCTYRQGAYIKDLSSVEPDLSNVLILDNSPLSYLFHEDNAIPIQGWINDPTDTDLMHLVPLLEGLQYVHDVRALLALRGGEDGQHAV
jgi:CTD nuclear envelope phosphatase 1